MARTFTSHHLKLNYLCRTQHDEVVILTVTAIAARVTATAGERK